MTFIIVDVESSGLPVGRKADYKDLEKYENARIVQLSFMVCNEDLEQIDFKDFVIKADGFSIDNSEFHWVTNKISEEQGIPFAAVATELSKFLPDCSHILAHNADFDTNIIKSELYRYKLYDILNAFETKQVLCTMKHTMHMVGIQGKFGVKYPTLGELYKYMFNEPIENAHNSMYDVINLHKIVKALYDTNRLQL